MAWEALYPYTADLCALALCRAPTGEAHPMLRATSSPLNPGEWEVALRTHPDRAFVRLLLTGITEGFRIGFSYPAPLCSAGTNMHSAMEHPEVIQTYLEGECAKGRMLGPFSRAEAQSLPPLHINRFGVIPKGHDTGKWRLITDLLYPLGESVNDGISPELCSLTYTSVDKVAEVASGYGRGALLAKIDVESAYRLIPVHPTDRPLQAMEWRGQIYVDPMLPFGLQSAPKLFNVVADALEWHLRQKGIKHVFHYLNDFVVVARPTAPDCAAALGIIDAECARLGIPITEHKRDGPTTCLTFLGIEIEQSLPSSDCQQTRLVVSSHSWPSGVTGKPAREKGWSRWSASLIMRAKWSGQVVPF